MIAYACTKCHRVYSEDLISNPCPKCFPKVADNTKQELNVGTHKEQTGLKFDTHKVPIGLISSIAIEGLATVLAFGASKYGKNNWRKGIEWQRLIDAAFRHLLAFNKGQDLDTESGLNHIDHAMCCLMFLREYYETHKQLDDRYKRV